MNRPDLTATRSDGRGPCALDEAGLVIFDFDGVIADSEVISLETLRQSLADHGIAMSLDEVRDRFLGTSLATISAFVAERALGSDPTGFASHWQSALFSRFRAELEPVPHVEAVLDRLHAAGTPYCIASSGTFERIGVALGAMGLTDRFAHVFSAEVVARGKPAPDLFEHAARELGVPPERCLVIEDAPFGVRAAKAAGMRCTAFLGGRHLAGRAEAHADLLLSEGADIVLASFEPFAVSCSGERSQG